MNKPVEDNQPSAEDAMKKRLLSRIAVAAVMVVALLGSLAIFDALNAPTRTPPKMASLPPTSETPPATEPSAESPPAAPTTITTGPNAPEPAAPKTETPDSDPKAAPKVDTKAESRPEPKAVPEGTASPGAPPLQPLPPGPKLTKPATGQVASIRPSAPLTQPGAAARPDAGSLTHTPQAARTVPSRPLSEAALAGRAPPPPGAELPPDRMFALQMGVFTNTSNAEDLRLKLELAGIPSTIEARVHVGPFKTRAEADAAREKLKELGLDGGLLITMKR